MTDNRSRR